MSGEQVKDLINREHIVKALELDLPYFDREMPRSGQEAAVLVLLSSDAQLLLTRRTETVDTHKGQIAFPGGRKDTDDAHAVATALRETKEEVGVPPSEIEVVGEMPLFHIPASGYQVVPVVGLLKPKRETVVLKPQLSETAEIFWVPLQFFLDEADYKVELREYQGRSYPVHVYQWRSYRIWGATAFMIKNFCDRLKQVKSIY